MSKHKKPKPAQPPADHAEGGQSPVDKDVAEHVHDAPRRDDDLSVLLSSSNPEQKPKP
jgi:hypothetical protein